MAKRLTYWILFALVLGVVVGWGLNFMLGDGTPEGGPVVKEVARYLSILTTIFLHLIKMIIAPLVFSTLVVGIAHMGDTAALGRVGAKALGWFVAASLVSLTLGLILVTLFQPGTGLGLPLPPADASGGIDRSAFDIVKFFGNSSPNRDPAMSRTASSRSSSSRCSSEWRSRGRRAGPAAGLGDRGLVKVMLVITDYGMRFAPSRFRGGRSTFAHAALDPRHVRLFSGQLLRRPGPALVLLLASAS